MAKIVGAAGAHAGKQSVAAFKKMFATVLIIVAVIAFAEGVMLTSLVTLRGRLPWYLIPIGIGLLAVWIVRIANFRVKKHETDRMTWRKGALGEYEVGAELERLPDDYLVFNDINTEEFGNFDHIVVGPKGIFAIETKNWSGLIGTNAAGELTRNGKPLWRSHIRMLERKEISEKHHGTINKYLGDGFLAYWPEATTNPEEIVGVICALRELQQKGAPNFRFVLHFGSVAIGGIPSLGEESLVGQEVNLVFRLEELAGSLGESRGLSDIAKAKLEELVAARALGEHELKGFQEKRSFFAI